MKSKIRIIGAALLAVVIVGCATSKPSDTAVRLQQAKDAVVPVVSSGLRRAITRSPEHAQQIVLAARGAGNVFCSMSASNVFSPAVLVESVDQATAPYQAGLPDEAVDAKNAALAIYKILYADQLTVTLPDNAWMRAVCGLFCDAIGQALKDSGY